MNSFAESDIALGMLTLALPLATLLAYSFLPKPTRSRRGIRGHWFFAAHRPLFGYIPSPDELKDEPMWFHRVDRAVTDAMLEIVRMPPELQREVGRELLRRVEELDPRPRTAN